MFGPLKFRLARTRQQIDRDVSLGRVGRELYPVADLDRGVGPGAGNVGGQPVYGEVDSYQRSRCRGQLHGIPASLNPRSLIPSPSSMFRLSLYPVFDSYLLVAVVALVLVGLMWFGPSREKTGATASGGAGPAAGGRDRAGDAGHAPADADLHANEEAGGHAGRAGRPVAEHVGARRRGQQDPLGGPATARWPTPRRRWPSCNAISS